MIGALFGASVGVFVRVWANAMGKQHFLARPWNHVAMGGLGFYIGSNFSKWEKDLLTEVNILRVDKGLLPITRVTLSGVHTEESN
eukprot:scaffold601_cov170-Ochromonas_danica.AAC.12